MDDRDGWSPCGNCGGDGNVNDYEEDEWYEEEDDEPEYYYDPEWEEEMERQAALDRLYWDVIPFAPVIMERGADGVGYHPLPF